MAIWRAAAWMIGTLLSFAAMAIAIRELPSAVGPFQILFLRSLAGLAIVGLLGFRAWPRIARSGAPALQIGRNVVHVAGQSAWILALGLLPLADAFALEFTAPLWAALAARLFLGEALTAPRLIAMAAGATGVFLIVRPGFEAVGTGVGVMLGAALCFGIVNVATKKLTATDPPMTILLWMTASQSLLTMAPALWAWAPVGWAEAPALAVIALTGLSAHYCLSRAFLLADALTVLPMEFLRLPLIAIVGFALYDEALDPWTLIGGLVIFWGVRRALAADARAAQRQ